MAVLEAADDRRQYLQRQALAWGETMTFSTLITIPGLVIFLPGQTHWSPNRHWGHATSTDLLHCASSPRRSSRATANGAAVPAAWSEQPTVGR